MKSQPIAKAALHGGMAWCVYGVVECAYRYLEPRYFAPETSVLTLWHLRQAAALLGLYAGFGLVAGCVTYPALRAAARFADARGRTSAGDFASASGILSLGLALALNFFPWPYRKLLLLLFLVEIALSVVVAGALFFAGDRYRGRPLAGAWTMSCAAIGIPWLRMQTVQGDTTNVAWAVTFVIAVAGFGGICRWLWSALAPVRRQSLLIDQMVGVSAGMAATLLLGLAAGRGAVGDLPAAQARQGRGGRPDIVLAVMDTVRADHTSIGGYERDTTPNLRMLADSATLYARATAVSGMTLPAHASMFTGLYPRRHGAHFDPVNGPAGWPLDERFETAAELLSGVGYSTAAVVANHLYVTREMGLATGFDLFDGRVLDASRLIAGDRLLHRFSGHLLDEFPALETERKFLRAEEMNEGAFQVLDSLAGSDAPLFLFLNYMDAHNPYLPPAPFAELYPGRDAQFRAADYDELLTEVMTHARRPTSVEYEALISQYDGAISYIDGQIGELISKLRASGRLENTLVIVTSDHGEAFGEHHTMRHGFLVYQNEIAVPLVVKYPGQKQGETVDFPVSQVDIAATIFSMAGVRPSYEIDGRDLEPGSAAREEPAFAESYPNPLSPTLHESFRTGRLALVSGKWKLIRGEAGGRELYDVEADPEEQHELAGEENSVADSLDGALDEWLERTPEMTPQNQPAVNPETLRRLRSLGYTR